MLLMNIQPQGKILSVNLRKVFLCRISICWKTLNSYFCSGKGLQGKKILTKTVEAWTFCCKISDWNRKLLTF